MRHAHFLKIATILLVTLAFSSNNAASLCGDTNGNGKVELSDISCIINALYRGGPAPITWDVADVDNSGKCDLRDAAYLINYIYRGGLDPVCPSTAASGGLIGHGSCKSYLESLPPDTVTDNHDCIAYNYDGLGMLTLRHINAVLNCCPIFASKITIKGYNIIIEELDSLYQGGCDCTCLFDLDYRISNLSPGVYHLKIIEPYVDEHLEQLEFDVDLSAAASGLFCLLRYGYPRSE